VQGPAGDDPRVVGTQLLAEIEAFLVVRPSGGQLAAKRKPAAPGAPAARHGDRLLVGRRLIEEGPRLDLEPP
jgi:hypothetical protein